MRSLRSASVMVIIITLPAWIPGLLFGGDLKITDWSHMARLEIPGAAPDQLVEFSLGPDMYDKARPDFGDFRIVADAEHEIGYIMRTERGSTRKVPFHVKLYNRSHVPGKLSSVTVDFGHKILKNRISVKTGGTNFRRVVRVEGSDDGQDWKTVRDRAFLFRFQEQGDKTSVYGRSDVTLPDNNHRRLKITVFNGADDPDVVAIEEVKAWRQMRTFPKTVEVPVVSKRTVQKKRVTEIYLDLGFRHMPLHELRLAFSDPNFFRRIKVYGRNSETRVIRTPVEDSPALERKIKTPWNKITQAAIFRFTAQGTADESSTVKLKQRKYRYIRVTVDNKSDPALQFIAAEVTRLKQWVAFARKKTGQYAVYLGNPRVKKPDYDIGRYVDRLRKAGMIQAKVGDLIPNPLYGPSKKPIPWSERHGSIIWLALLAMMAVLGFLVYRMATSPGKTES